jgi:hypothetical protein
LGFTTKARRSRRTAKEVIVAVAARPGLCHYEVANADAAAGTGVRGKGPCSDLLRVLRAFVVDLDADPFLIAKNSEQIDA